MGLGILLQRSPWQPRLKTTSRADNDWTRCQVPAGLFLRIHLRSKYSINKQQGGVPQRRPQVWPFWYVLNPRWSKSLSFSLSLPSLLPAPNTHQTKILFRTQVPVSLSVQVTGISCHALSCLCLTYHVIDIVICLPAPRHSFKYLFT